MVDDEAVNVRQQGLHTICDGIIVKCLTLNSEFSYVFFHIYIISPITFISVLFKLPCGRICLVPLAP
jgi:hypothetical protein